MDLSYVKRKPQGSKGAREQVNFTKHKPRPWFSKEARGPEDGNSYDTVILEIRDIVLDPHTLDGLRVCSATPEMHLYMVDGSRKAVLAHCHNR